MFEDCKDLSELNQKRIQLIASGNPAATVNKYYSRRKAELLKCSTRQYKEVPFIHVTAPSVNSVYGLSYVEITEDPYRMVVHG